MTVQVTGLKETVKSLKRFGVEVSDLKAAFKRIGERVANEAKTLAPTKTGKLAGSVRAAQQQNKAVIRAGGARLPYAGVIHYGWPAHGIEPHPFLTDAIDSNRGESIAMLEQELKDLIQKLDLN